MQDIVIKTLRTTRVCVSFVALFCIKIPRKFTLVRLENMSIFLNFIAGMHRAILDNAECKMQNAEFRLKSTDICLFVYLRCE